MYTLSVFFFVVLHARKMYLTKSSGEINALLRIHLHSTLAALIFPITPSDHHALLTYTLETLTTNAPSKLSPCLGHLIPTYHKHHQYATSNPLFQRGYSVPYSLLPPFYSQLNFVSICVIGAVCIGDKMVAGEAEVREEESGEKVAEVGLK
ncbi:hypothetical protein BDQ17DRAFT_1434016 [Cyathus striatus]|nr:hypothetical protein BDQ17DRAFT_1434016 [Cyathus striatus]